MMSFLSARRMEDSFRIHIYTSEGDIVDEARILTAFLDSGADCIHLRKPGKAADYIRSVLEKLPKRHINNVTLHSYPELAAEYGTGFQLNSRCPRSDFDFIRLSKSCHTINEVAGSSELDFVTLSPVFNSISKKGYEAAFNIPDLNLKGFKTDIIALGGVELSGIDSLKTAGFAGAAFLGSVWNRENGVKDMLKYLRMRNVCMQFITDGKDIMTTLRQAGSALEGGCRWIQVRMKDADSGEVRETLQELMPRCGEYCATLIVDDNVELADICHGVHLGQNDMPVAEARKKFSTEKIIGLTVNNPEQLKASEDSLPDYYGIGPYRFTTTKKNLAPVLGIEGYKRMLPELKRPFVAIGGIHPEDIPAMKDAGIKGFAISSVITQSDDPAGMTEKLTKLIY